MNLSNISHYCLGIFYFLFFFIFEILSRYDFLNLKNKSQIDGPIHKYHILKCELEA